MKLDDLAVIAKESGDAPSDPPQPKQTGGTWASMAKTMAAIGSIGGVVIHLIGYVSHQSYLSAWGIDPGLFPKPVNEIAMTGYYAVMDRSASILSVMKGEAWKLLGAGIAIMVYAFVLLSLNRWQKREKVVCLFQKTPEWLGDLAKSLWVTTFILATIPIALFITIFVLFIPAAFGDSFGRSLAEREQKSYMAGCQQARGVSICIELRKDGNPIARGFMLESSKSHIAIFDINKQKARAIERAGTELLADAPYKLVMGSDAQEPTQR